MKTKTIQLQKGMKSFCFSFKRKHFRSVWDNNRHANKREKNFPLPGEETIWGVTRRVTVKGRRIHAEDIVEGFIADEFMWPSKLLLLKRCLSGVCTGRGEAGRNL